MFCKGSLSHCFSFFLWPHRSQCGCGSKIGAQNATLAKHGLKPVVPCWFNVDPRPNSPLDAPHCPPGHFAVPKPNMYSVVSNPCQEPAPPAPEPEAPPELPPEAEDLEAVPAPPNSTPEAELEPEAAGSCFGFGFLFAFKLAVGQNQWDPILVGR